ncbi:glycosyltransferase family 4 protein [Candidatus Uhrbacteria bacterium]|nr:glycosyltransferase family 4 protein [Candidatus Uhrbacteria bacterium]
MRILHVNKFFDLRGGAEVYLHELMARQRDAGHDVHALSTRSPNNLPSSDAFRFVTRYDLSISDGSSTDAKKAANFLWNREAKRAMQQTLDELKPDVVHLHNIYHHLSTSILGPIRRSRVRSVQTLHDLKLACPNYRMYTEGAPCERCKGGRYYEAVKHRCLFPNMLPNMLAALEMGMTKARQSYERTVSTFICPSQFMADKMVEWGEPPSKFTVVRMPVVRRERAPRGGGYLLAVGRLSPEKGYEELIHATARVPGMRIKIAGTGPLEDRLRSLIRANERTSDIELVGFKRGQELEDLYRYAEAFIACPIGHENAPLAVLDALGVGLPILATDFSGLREMVADGQSGVLVERGNTDAWVEALKRFQALGDQEREEMARQSAVLAETNYPDWKGHVNALQDIYEAV